MFRYYLEAVGPSLYQTVMIVQLCRRRQLCRSDDQDSLYCMEKVNMDGSNLLVVFYSLAFTALFCPDWTTLRVMNLSVQSSRDKFF